MSSEIYIYAAIDGDEAVDLDPVGVGDPPGQIRTHSYGDFRLVYSEVPGGKSALSLPDVRAHQSVVERLLVKHTVLPFSFGTFATGADSLDELVRRAGQDIRVRLRELAGRVEMGLKVFWHPDVMRREVGLPTQPAVGVTAHHSEAIRVGQLVEQRVSQWREQYVPRITRMLAPLCDGTAEGEIVAPTMLWNASFLIHRDRQPKMRAVIERLDRQLGNRLDFRLAGPFPPYSFVNLRVAMGDEEALQ